MVRQTLSLYNPNRTAFESVTYISGNPLDVSSLLEDLVFRNEPLHAEGSFREGADFYPPSCSLGSPSLVKQLHIYEPL